MKMQYFTTAILGLLATTLFGVPCYAQTITSKKMTPFDPWPWKCVAASGALNGFWYPSNDEFVLSKEIFTGTQRIAQSGELTCRANKQYRTLNLYVAMHPEGKGTRRVTVFKDQTESASYTISPGKQGPMMFDIAGAKFFSIAISCDTGQCSDIYLSRSQLETGSYDPGSRNK
jgi:hypothetical protein